MEEFQKTGRIKVLMYHRVVEEAPPKQTHWHYVTLSKFKRQMKIIEKLGFTPINFYDYLLYKEGKLTLPTKPVIITFDDGYLDTFEQAVPVLREMDMTAVIFVMGNRNLERAFWDELNEEDVCPLMSDEQIRIADQQGFEIGAHSFDHVDLVNLSDRDISCQIKKSKEAIESVLNKRIYTFAYPYGSVDERVRDIVAASDFLFACGVYTGSAKFGDTLFDFRRLAVNQHTTTLNFLSKITLPYQYAEWFYHRLKSNKMSLLQKRNYLTEKTLEKRENGKNIPSEYTGKDI